MTCRPGWLAWAPMACGRALAMEPWLNEPISRRVPFIRRYRAAQMHGVPTSAVNTASAAASRSTVAATYCGCSGESFRRSRASLSSRARARR